MKKNKIICFLLIFTSTCQVTSQVHVKLKLKGFSNPEIYLTKKDKFNNNLVVGLELISDSVIIPEGFLETPINYFIVDENKIFLLNNLKVPLNGIEIECGTDTTLNKRERKLLDSTGISLPAFYFYAIVYGDGDYPLKYTQLINQNYIYEECDRIRFIMAPDKFHMFNEMKK